MNFKKKLKFFLFSLFLLIVIGYIFTNRGYIGSLIHPLPFHVPEQGVVIDAFTKNPIAGVHLMATWSCYDSPYPHIGEYFVYTHAKTNNKGYFQLNKPKKRGGWFGGSFSIKVSAKGYIPTILYLDFSNNKSNQDSQEYPFINVINISKFKKDMNIKLIPAKNILLKALKSNKVMYKQLAAEKIGEIGEQAEYAVTPLIEALFDKNTDVQLSSVKALGSIGKNAKKAVNSLTKILNNKNKNLQLAAIDAIGNIGYADNNTINLLIGFLEDKDITIIEHTVICLGKLGTNAKNAVPLLENLLKRKWISKYLQINTKYALKQIISK